MALILLIKLTLKLQAEVVSYPFLFDLKQLGGILISQLTSSLPAF